MKTLQLLAALILLNIALFAQSENPRSIWKIKWGESEYNIGGYIGMNTKYSQLKKESVGYLDLKAGVTINSKWTIGFAGTGLYYDKKLSKLVSDGTYHLYAGYAGLFVERMITLGEGFNLNLSLLSGQGEAYYQYDKDYRENRPWYQEVIDKETFHVFEPGIEIQKQIFDNWYIGLAGSYRFTSPLKLVGTDDDALSTFSGGLSIKYGIF